MNFTVWLRAGALIAGLAGLSACAAGQQAYVSVDSAQPGAQMRFLKTYAAHGFGAAGLDAFALSADRYCDSVRGAASMTWTTADETTLRVTPDAPMLVWAGTSYFVSNQQTTCRTVARFTPLRDHAYDVRHLSNIGSSQCVLEITDVTTGAPAPIELLFLNECVKRRTPAA